jgi:hypothetical protein
MSPRSFVRGNVVQLDSLRCGRGPCSGELAAAGVTVVISSFPLPQRLSLIRRRSWPPSLTPTGPDAVTIERADRQAPARCPDPVPAFRASEQEISPVSLEIGGEGELDLAVADRLQEAIERCRGRQTLIDLEDCEFIDLTGIASPSHGSGRCRPRSTGSTRCDLTVGVRDRR